MKNKSLQNSEEITLKTDSLPVIIHESGESPQRFEAVDLHHRLLRDGEAAAIAFTNFTERLKEMRDRKLYTELGYDSFGKYTAEALGINERQSYNYINNLERLGNTFLHSNAKLGVTKLHLLAAASAEERNKVVEYNDVENMSVRQLKEALAKVASLEQQLTFLQENPVTVVEQAPLDEIESRIRQELESEYAGSNQDDYAEKIDKLERDLAASERAAKESREKALKAEKDAELKIKDELKKIKEQLKAAEEAERESAEKIAAAEEAKELAEQDAAKAKENILKYSELESKVRAAEEAKSAMEKQIKLSANPELARFKFMFEDIQSGLSALLAQLDKLDADIRPKMKEAVRALIGGIKL